MEDERIGDQAAGEARLIDRLINRLATDWPQFDKGDISETVHRHLAEYDSSAVRDYVPVLVERAVDEELQQRTDGDKPEAHGPLWTRER